MILLKGFLSVIVTLAQAQGGAPVRVEFCRLVSAPEMYIGKRVQTTAIVRMGSGEQGMWLVDQKCSEPVLVANTAFPKAVVITADPETDEGRRVTIDEASLAELQAILLRSRGSGTQVTATVTGVFESRIPYSNLVVEGVARGYGHLGGFPFQLIFQTAQISTKE